MIRERINATHLDNGVTIVDPNATYIDVDVTIGRDTVVRPMTFLEGETRIGPRRRSARPRGSSTPGSATGAR